MSGRADSHRTFVIHKYINWYSGYLQKIHMKDDILNMRRLFFLPVLLFLVCSFFIIMSGNALASENLSMYRPVTVSSTGHYPCIAEFAVDDESGTGWRSARKYPDGQKSDWLITDLQAECQVNMVKIIWASESALPVFHEIQTADLSGSEQVTSYGLEYSISVSSDGQKWQSVYSTNCGSGGMEIVHLEPVAARYLKVDISKRSDPVCGVEIREIAVLGSCKAKRPEGDSWKLSRKQKDKPVILTADNSCNVLVLDKGWELYPESWSTVTASEISNIKADTSSWYNATVPGTILTTLVDQDVFPDPAIGMNNLQIPDSLCRMVWWYRSELNISKKWYSDNNKVWLEFDGINHDAELWLNSHYLGQINGAFTRGKFDITDILANNGKNALAVRILPPAHPGIPLEKSEQNKIKNGGALGKDSPTFVASIGWDWLPGIRDRGIGIWDEVRICRSGGVVMEDPQVITDLPLPDTSKADITINVPISNVTELKQNVSVEAILNDILFSKQVELSPGERAEICFSPGEYSQLCISDPRLWWPAGYGKQELYDLKLTVKTNGITSDEQSLKFGIREFSYRGSTLKQNKQEQYKFNPVSAKYVRLNCLSRATKYGFSIFDLAVYNSKNSYDNLALNKPVNVSSVESDEHPAAYANDIDLATRWSSEYSEPHWIYVDLGKSQVIDLVKVSWEAAYAKHFTIQVSDDGISWKDVKDCIADDEPEQLEISVNGKRVLCRGGNWGYPELLLRNTDMRLETSIRLHSEANLNMIRNWVGQSTTEKFYQLCDKYGILVWNDFWLANPSDGPDPLNNKLFLDNVSDAVKRYRNHPSIAIWCGRNEGFPPKELNEGIKKLTDELDGTRYYQSHSASAGVNGHGPYRYITPASYFDNFIGGFKTEIGMPSVPIADTMRKMLDDKDPWPLNAAWAYHDFAPIGAQSRGTYISALETRYGKANNVDDFCRKAQLINYDGYRAIFEACNHKLWDDCSGLLLWMSHPAWPSTVWQIYDYWYGTDGAYFGTQKANESVHIQYCPSNKMIELINHTSEQIDGMVSVKVLTVDADVFWEKSTAVIAIENAKTDAFVLEVPQDSADVFFVKLTWTEKHGQSLSENYYIVSKEDSDVQAINRLPQVGLDCSMYKTSNDSDRNMLQVELKNNCRSIAYMANVTLYDSVKNARILPAFYSDNYMTFLPGESKIVNIDYGNNNSCNAVKVKVDGWNIVPQSIE